MNQDRKKIIINEILYWRENKLLPESYCNFLISIYTEGEGIETPPTSKPTKKSFISILGIGLLLPVLFLVTYFTEISPILQMVIHIIFLIVCILGVVLNRNNQIFLHIGSIILALFVLLFSVNIVDFIFSGQEFLMTGIILLNCFGWALIGLFSKKKYFLVAGILGIITSCFILLNI